MAARGPGRQVWLSTLWLFGTRPAPRRVHGRHHRPLDLSPETLPGNPLHRQPTDRGKGRIKLSEPNGVERHHPPDKLTLDVLESARGVQDAADPAVYYLGARPETPEGLADTFAASDHRVMFTGHFHRWLAATPDGLLPWDGIRPLALQQGRRYLIVVAAVCDGWCAVFDTASGELIPLSQGPGRPLL
jgi:hypothetical protein